MRLTVGPLPATVYWRRRAMVIGVTVIAILMVVYSCTASGKPNGAAQPNPTPIVSPQGAQAATSAEPTPEPTGGLAPVGEVSPSAGPVPTVDPKLCTDLELKVTAVVGQSAYPRDTSFQISLLVKNVANRTCFRDVGADVQELYVKNGTETIWSSDHCDPLRGSNVLSFAPKFERSYQVIWNGRSSSSCSKTSKRTPDGPAPSKGEYQVFGRVGTDLSDPVTVKLT